MPAERKILPEPRVLKGCIFLFSAGRYIYLYIYIYELWVDGPALVPARWLNRSVAMLLLFCRLRTVGRRRRLFSCQGAVGRIWSPHISVNKRGSKSTPLGYLFWEKKSFYIFGHLCPRKAGHPWKIFESPFTYSEVRRGKSQPWVGNFFSPLTNYEFQPPICKPCEVKFPIFDCLKKNPSIYPDIWEGQSQPKSESFWKTSSLIPTFEGRFVNPDRKILFDKRCPPIYPDI